MKIKNFGPTKSSEPHQLINQTSGNVEFFTPQFIIEAARRVLHGKIDLDPASSRAGNKRVRASKIFTAEDNGLIKKWRGSIWMNHPFGFAERRCDITVTGKPCTKKICKTRGYCRIDDYPGNAGWINKLIKSHKRGEVTEALCICFAATSETWFQPLMEYPACFLYPRTNYCDTRGNVVKGVSKGSVIFYLGEDLALFKKVFSAYGKVKV